MREYRSVMWRHGEDEEQRCTHVVVVDFISFAPSSISVQSRWAMIHASARP